MQAHGRQTYIRTANTISCAFIHVDNTQKQWAAILVVLHADGIYLNVELLVFLPSTSCMRRGRHSTDSLVFSMRKLMNVRLQLLGCRLTSAHLIQESRKFVECGSRVFFTPVLNAFFIGLQFHSALLFFNAKNYLNMHVMSDNECSMLHENEYKILIICYNRYLHNDIFSTEHFPFQFYEISMCFGMWAANWILF